MIEQRIQQVKQWHIDRNLIDGASDKDQVCKLIQEVGELSDNVCKNKDVADDIGDIMVVLINIAERNGLSLEHCLDVAYMILRTARVEWLMVFLLRKVIYE
jgi:NTP pyrophosphatase (non-canonical NTP hydrolase)